MTEKLINHLKLMYKRPINKLWALVGQNMEMLSVQ